MTVQAVLAPAATWPEVATTRGGPASTPLAAVCAAPLAAWAARPAPDAAVDAASPALPAASPALSPAVPAVRSAGAVALPVVSFALLAVDRADTVLRFGFLFCSLMDTDLPQTPPANTPWAACVRGRPGRRRRCGAR